MNILALSQLLFVSSVLSPPRWLFDRINNIIWPFLWGSQIETVARKTLICSVAEGDLGLRDFRTQGQASRLALLVRIISERQWISFYLVKYFCGAQLLSIQRCWADLQDNYSPSAVSPSPFYSSLLTALRDFHFPPNFSFTSKDFYSSLLSKIFTIPIFTYLWTPFVSSAFSLPSHWQRIGDSVTENHKNDLAWIITLIPVMPADRQTTSFYLK